MGGAMALLVIGALVPSESAISDGTYAPLVAGACLLAVVWGASLLLDDQPAFLAFLTGALGAAGHLVAVLRFRGPASRARTEALPPARDSLPRSRPPASPSAAASGGLNTCRCARHNPWQNPVWRYPSGRLPPG